MNTNAQTPDTSGRLMTVANVYDTTNPKEITVLFFESPRMFKLCRSNPQFTKTFRQLMEALLRKKPVKVFMTKQHGDVIERVTNDL